MAYTILITLHSILRWLVILAAVYALYRAYRGWLGRKEWAASDRRAGAIFTGIFDLQVMVGLVLYFFASPITRAFLADVGAGMAIPAERFFGLVHIGLMVLAVLVAHMGSVFSRRGADASRHRTAALLYSLSIVIVLLAIPWPFEAVGRPLL
jgi:hypothetical protein